MDWPGASWVLTVRQNSGRCLRGSHWCPGSRRLKMRSLARLRSSSRRAPPIAASKPYRSMPSRRATVFIRRVYSWVPWLNGRDALGDRLGVLAMRRSRP